MPKLFDLAPEMVALQQLIEETEGEIIGDDTEKALDAFFAEIGDAQAAKLDGYVGVIKSIEGEAAVAKATADQFIMKARARENAAKRLKERVKAYFEVTGQAKAMTASGFTLAIQNNGGKQPLDLDASFPVTDLPSRFQKVVISADNDAIRKALEDGEALDYARLQPRGTHLRVR